jgi:O-antigen/teichoic acid export membrane protein
MRSKKVLYNVVTSFWLQIITIICGFIVPKLIIVNFGSDVNGLISSITQFLGYIVLLEAGVGGVARSALFKPLAVYDQNKISGIIKATRNFFRSIAFIYLLYLLIIAISFPYIPNHDFGNLFTISLVLIIGISSFVQYYLGITYQVLLQADQKLYIINLVQIVALIINTILIVVLVKIGASIHIIKFLSSLVFILRPVVMFVYVNNKYKLDKYCSPDDSAIKQKWDGFGHHLAFFVHTNTDVVLLTFFTNFKVVSVYTVYFMVVTGIEKLTNIFSSSIEAAFGNMIAKGETDNLDRNFRVSELISSMIITILFTSTALLIIEFITLYTSEINDANYIRPYFAYIMVVSQAVYCLRLPYNALVLAAGHYKQTRNGAFVEVGINICVSIILVNSMGLEGVAIGTLVAMIFRTIQYASYLSKHIIKRSITVFIKRVSVNVGNALIILLTFHVIPKMEIKTYFDWGIYAIIILLVSLIISILINILFYKSEINFIIRKCNALLKMGK